MECNRVRSMQRETGKGGIGEGGSDEVREGGRERGEEGGEGAKKIEWRGPERRERRFLSSLYPSTPSRDSRESLLPVSSEAASPEIPASPAELASRNGVKAESKGEAEAEFGEDLGLRFSRDCKRTFEVMWCFESLFVGVFSTDLLRSACRESSIASSMSSCRRRAAG